MAGLGDLFKTLIRGGAYLGKGAPNRAYPLSEKLANPAPPWGYAKPPFDRIDAPGQTGWRPPGGLYHVAPEDLNIAEGLSSLRSRLGNDAYPAYSLRWPEGTPEHADQTMFYNNLGSARDHVAEYGGKILKADPSYLNLFFDRLERPGFWATQEAVPGEALTLIPPQREVPR